MSVPSNPLALPGCMPKMRQADAPFLSESVHNSHDTHRPVEVLAPRSAVGDGTASLFKKYAATDRVIWVSGKIKKSPLSGDKGDFQMCDWSGLLVIQRPEDTAWVVHLWLRKYSAAWLIPKERTEGEYFVRENLHI
jgi:hypothetical protein